MPDILPSQTPLWQHIEHEVTTLLHAYAYREIRLPLLEPTELFQRSIGEVTDIVEKEMYTFADRNGDSLTLRPEGTAGCVRAVLQNGLLHNLPQRLWYLGPMFRHERPQMGRQRQFHQIGVESFGLPGPDIEAEHLLLLARLWRRLGIDGLVTLEINSLGSSGARANYREALVGYLGAHADQLDEDSRRRLGSNPLRILDSKDPGTRELLAGAPRLTRSSRRGIARAHAAGCARCSTPRGSPTASIRRWCAASITMARPCTNGSPTASAPRAPSARAGVTTGSWNSWAGRQCRAWVSRWALERLVLLLEVAGSQPDDRARPHAYWVVGDAAAQRFAFVLAERLRDRLPWLRLQMHCGEGRMKSQMKKADRSGADAGADRGRGGAGRGRGQRARAARGRAGAVPRGRRRAGGLPGTTDRHALSGGGQRERNGERSWILTVLKKTRSRHSRQWWAAQRLVDPDRRRAGAGAGVRLAVVAAAPARPRASRRRSPTSSCCRPSMRRPRTRSSAPPPRISRRNSRS